MGGIFPSSPPSEFTIDKHEELQFSPRKSDKIDTSEDKANLFHELVWSEFL